MERGEVTMRSSEMIGAANEKKRRLEVVSVGEANLQNMRIASLSKIYFSPIAITRY